MVAETIGVLVNVIGKLMKSANILEDTSTLAFPPWIISPPNASPKQIYQAFSLLKSYRAPLDYSRLVTSKLISPINAFTTASVGARAVLVSALFDVSS